MILDQNGRIYGTTSEGGSGGGGTVFELTAANGTWTLAVLGSFNGVGGSFAGLVTDKAGNLYGTTLSSVFELTPSGGVWMYTSLHNFNGHSDGGQLYGSVLVDAAGNLHGTASSGGAYGFGVVRQITP